MSRSRILTIASLGAALLVVLIVAFQVYQAASSRRLYDALLGTPFAPERDAPAVSLIDQRGSVTPLVDPHASATFVFFGSTQCKDASPLALPTLATAYRPQPQAPAVLVEAVMVRPARAAPAVLARHAAECLPHLRA